MRKAFIEWLSLSADLGHANAQFMLGGLYNFGKGVQKDMNKAFELYTLGVDQGHAKAQFSLGRCYTLGEPCKVYVTIM